MVELVQEAVVDVVVAVASRSAQVVLAALVWVVGRVVVVFLLVVTLAVWVLYSLHSSLGGGKSKFDVPPHHNYSSGSLDVAFFDLFLAQFESVDLEVELWKQRQQVVEAIDKSHWKGATEEDFFDVEVGEWDVCSKNWAKAAGLSGNKPLSTGMSHSKGYRLMA
ncbi:hypothetical protein L7F22_012022 [Adiantum nelumboides]|nr:hypothetical protein [Adiantum nelumboides]